MQGCSLSPGLFALAVEPLATLIRATDSIHGIHVGVVEKISLNANDTLLYLNDVVSSLPAALQIIFVAPILYKLNWGKSLLFLLHPAHPKQPTGNPLCWVDEFTCLGITVGRSLVTYYDLNVLPLLQHFSQQCTSWTSLPLTPVDRVNLVKMLFL